MIEMKKIFKSFGANDVLKDVNIEVKEGEIIALLGENGAGKSTLMNILGGVVSADSGKIILNGKDMIFNSPRESMDSGIAFIHQELNLINDLPVYENMFLGNELVKENGFLDLEEMYNRTLTFFEDMEVEIDPNTMVADLDSSYKQIIEILRSLMLDAKYIIMDEPTTSLTEPEIERVFGIMNNLKAKGVGIVFISHKLNEVMEICDKYIVLRNGSVVDEGWIDNTSADSLAVSMVGHDVRTEKLTIEKSIGREILKLSNLTLEPFYRNINLTVRQGEILGVTGLLGDGRSQVFQSVFGYLNNYDGEIYLDGEVSKIKKVKDAIRLGIGYLPNDRKENGIISDMTIVENGTVVIWDNNSKAGFIKRNKIVSIFDNLREKLNIKMENEKDLITKLSGGNQQKVVLSKWLANNPKILILDNPTQGVDVGSKEEIYDIILDLAKQGVSVIVLSNEAQEIVRICDRVVVMYHGVIKDELMGDSINERNIMRLATGGSV